MGVFLFAIKNKFRAAVYKYDYKLIFIKHGHV